MRADIAIQKDDGIVFLVYPGKGGLLIAALLGLMGRFARDNNLSPETVPLRQRRARADTRDPRVTQPQ